MRISDWSSDVCSSDLPVVGVAFHVHHVAMFVDQRDRRLEARALQAALVKVFRRGVGTGDQHHALGEHPLERSEEHTSELQSLLRSSYAVVCSNKKKHTKAQLCK